MSEGALSWTTPAWQSFASEAEDMLKYDEDSSPEGKLPLPSLFPHPHLTIPSCHADDENRICQAWIEIGEQGRTSWHQYAQQEQLTRSASAKDSSLEIVCILTLARFLRAPLVRIENGEGSRRWKGFGRWFLTSLDDAAMCAGSVCQAAIRARKMDGKGKGKWGVISEIFVAKLALPEETPLPEMIWELKIHELVTAAAASEGCEYIVPLRGGGPDRLAHCFTVLTDRAEYGNLEEVITRHSQDSDPREVPEAFIWYFLHALSQAALIMERGGIAGPREGWTKEIIHLDIRAPNIVLHRPKQEHFRRYPVPKLIDFGAAVATDDQDTQNPYAWPGRGAAFAAAPEMYWADWQERQRYEDRNPLTASRNHRLTSKTNIYQIGLVVRKLMTCNGNEAEDFSFDDDEEPEKGEEVDWEPDDMVHGSPAPPDYTVDLDADPEGEDDGKPDQVGPVDDGEAGYKNMEWREPHDVAIGSYSPELVKLVNYMLRFLPSGRPNAAAVYTYSRQHMKVWKKRQAYQPNRDKHRLFYRD